MSQKSASVLANDMLGRGLVPDTSPARLDGLRTLAGLSQWLHHGTDAAAILALGDSTGWSPGTTDGGALPVTGGYLRWVDQLATSLASSSLDATIRLHVNDFTNGNNRYQAPRVLKTASGGLRCVRLPSLSNYTLNLTKTAFNKFTGTHHFVAAKIKPTSWTPAALQTIISDWGNGSPNASWSFGMNTTGTLWWSYTQDGATAINRYSTVAPSGVTDASTVLWVGVDVQWNNGASGNTFTFYTSTDGHTWTQLGTPVTNAGVLAPFATTAPYQLGCRTIGGGAGSNFGGDLYEVQVRNGGMYGPTILPTQPDEWQPYNASTLMMTGGPQLDVVNASWPGQGLTQFDDPANLPLLVPHFPYLAAVLNTGHNDAGYDTQRTLADKWDRLIDRVTRRAAYADVAVLTQNPTLRTDGLNPPANRNLHTARMARLSAYAASNGLGVIDTFQAFADWAGGSGLADLLDSAGGPTQIIHPIGDGVTRQVQKIWDEAST